MPLGAVSLSVWVLCRQDLEPGQLRCLRAIPLEMSVEIERRYSEITKPEPKGEAGTRGVNVGVRA